jgi:stage IV sporulation protein FB
MGWEDRRHWSESPGGRGRFRDSLRRMFGDGSSFLDWSLPLYTAWGIRVKIHLIFVVMIIGRLLEAGFGNTSGAAGFGYMALGMGSLFVLVLLHEYGHCLACRWVGGEADQILMWPLGGLAYCRPPHAWRAALITTLGGPAVNAILLPILGGAVLLLTRNWHSVVFPPFDPFSAWGDVRLASTGLQPWWLIALWWFYFTNGILLVFNVLLPMYPMDGGRIVQEILWARIGHKRSMEIAATSGLVMAVILGVFALTFRETNLLGIALFAGVTCWMERRRQQFEAASSGLPGYDFDRGFAGMPGDEEDRPAGPTRADLKRREKAQAEQTEMDRILEKIARTGMASLSGKERRFLGQATERRRRG